MTDTPSPKLDDGLPGRDTRWLRSAFTLDLRSIATLRIALGLLILADLALRARDLTAHYTDAGVTTGSFLLDQYGPATYLSLHYWTGHSPALTGGLFILHALFALGLLVGFRSRLMAAACWFLGASLLKRNPSLYTAGDATVMFLLFWSMFLPIGAKCSIDAATDPRDDEPPNAYFGMISIALVLQVCFTYWFAAGMKLSSPMWIDGSAVHNALHRDWIADAPGVWLRQFESVLPAISYCALAAEILGPFLLFIPRMVCAGRLTAITLFALLHIGFAIAFNFGIFQWQSFAAWIVLLPACFWGQISAVTLNRPSRVIRCYFDGDCGFCRKLIGIVRELAMLPRQVFTQAQQDPGIEEEMRAENSWIVIDHRGKHRHRWDALGYVLRRGPLSWWLGALIALPGIRRLGDAGYRWIASNRDLCARLIAWLRWRPVRVRPTLFEGVIAFWIIVYIFFLNVLTLRPEIRKLSPPFANLPARVLQIDPFWAMFTNVETLDGWVVLQARLADGSRVDLFTGELPTHDKPELISRRYGSARWTKLTQSYAGMQTFPTSARWYPYAEHFADEWDKRHPIEKRVEYVEVYYVQDLPTGEIGEVYHWAEVDRRSAVR